MATRKVKPAGQPDPVRVDEPAIEIQTVAIALPKELADVETNLAKLRTEIANRVYDMTTTEGETACRKDRAALVRLRTTVEAIRVQAKRPILEAGRKLDAETTRVRVEIEALEEPRDAMIKALERKRAEAKAKRERIERERVESIKAKIAAMDRRPMFGAKAADIAAMIACLPAIIDTEEFEEFVDAAIATRRRAFDELTAAHIQAEATEMAAAEMAAQLEAANTARREAEERERVALVAKVEAERVAREQEAAREKAEAEAAAVREEAATPIIAPLVVDNGVVPVTEAVAEPLLPEIVDDRRLPKFSMQLHPSGPATGAPVMILKPLNATNDVAVTEPQRTVAPLFATVYGLCSHLLDVLTDDGQDDAKVRLCSLLLRANASVWGGADREMTGGGGGVDERNARVAENAGQ